jgi:hypothetical protein
VAAALFIDNFLQGNASTAATGMQLSVADVQAIAQANPYGFIASTQSPTREYEEMSSFLLADRVRARLPFHLACDK